MEIKGSAQTLSDNGGKIEVIHRDAMASFHYSSFKKDTLDKNEVFKQLNNFWKQKSQPFQEAVFEHYRKAADYYFQINDKDHLALMMNKEIRGLAELHPEDEMRHWLLTKSGITLPPIKENYEGDSDRDYTPEKTYIMEEYKRLLTYSFRLKLLVPIWSYYLRVVKDKDAAGTGLKEHRAFGLLEGTDMFDGPAVQKMQMYLTANSKKAVIRSGAIGLLSPEDHPRWIMEQFCVRKLCLAELQYRDPRATLASALFNFGTTSNTEGSFQDRYKDKGGKDGGGTDEGDGNKVSVYERHRNSTNRSVQEAAEYETTLQGVMHDYKLLCPSLPVPLLERSIRTAAPLLQIDQILNTALPCQKTILGWILSPILSPDGIPYQELDKIIEYLPLAEAMLWYRGFPFLSLLMTARTPVDAVIHQVTTQPMRARLTEENAAMLRKTFPHVRVVQNRKSDPREECFVINAIDEISAEIGEYSWVVTADESMLVATQHSKSPRLNISPEIRNDLARLILTIADKSFYNA